MTAILRVQTRGRDERRMTFDVDRIRIGRAADNELSIPDLSLSREHAQLARSGDAYTLTDLGSRNGTYLNDEAVVGEKQLAEGDVIQLGETTIVFGEEESGVHLAQQGRSLDAGSVIIPAEDLLRESFASVREDGRVVDVLAEVSRGLIAKASVDDVYRNVLDAAIVAAGAERGALMQLEGTPPELLAKATRVEHGEKALVLSSTIANTVLDERTSLITTDAQIDERFDGAQSISMQGIRSAMCAPLFHEGNVSGLLYVDRRLSARQFTKTDLALLTVLANLTAAKLENLRLLEEALAKRKLDEELALAADIQKNLLPRSHPNLTGFEFVATSVPSRSVGGDLYDYIEKPSGRLGVVVADVSGKGVSAALLMAALIANLRAFAASVEDPAEIMVATNDHLARSSTPNKYATVFYGELDPSTGRLLYVNGGHNPGLLVHKDGTVDALSVGGMIVGAFAGMAKYKVGEAQLDPGDSLVLYSDGVTEAERADEEQFGDERLRATVAMACQLSAADMRDAILESIHDFTGGLPASDDTTLMVVRRG